MPRYDKAADTRWGSLHVLQAHEHGFVREGTEVRTAYVTHNKQGATEVTAGLKDLQASDALASRVCWRCCAAGQAAYGLY